MYLASTRTHNPNYDIPPINNRTGNIQICINNFIIITTTTSTNNILVGINNNFPKDFPLKTSYKSADPHKTCSIISPTSMGSLMVYRRDSVLIPGYYKVEVT